MIAGGLALAVPSNAVKTFLEAGVSGPRLGVTVRPVLLDRRTAGLLLLGVEPGGAAEAASLMIGDVVVAVDGQPVRSAGDLSDALDRAPALLHLSFLRGDRKTTREVAVRLERRRAAA
jgi:serine protease Do